eukprot:5559598-Pyramimonas_sp.AAC.1
MDVVSTGWGVDTYPDRGDIATRCGLPRVPCSSLFPQFTATHRHFFVVSRCSQPPYPFKAIIVRIG